MKFKLLSKIGKLRQKQHWKKFYAIWPRRVEDDTMIAFGWVERRMETRWSQRGNKGVWVYREIMCPMTRRRLARERIEAEEAAWAQENYEQGYDNDMGWDAEVPANQDHPDAVVPQGMWRDVDGNLNQIPGPAPEPGFLAL